ncbi:hypothetical protein ACFV2X_52765 [Streptomyces sp. NPDC059679]|uniref:hypothetical protein n=1 Tax=Streptomyces sp. NPDC059679 TaxID=3346903 RepID=UPI0036AF8C27
MRLRIERGRIDLAAFQGVQGLRARGDRQQPDVLDRVQTGVTAWIAATEPSVLITSTFNFSLEK